MTDPLSGCELTKIKPSLHFERKDHRPSQVHTRPYPFRESETRAWVTDGRLDAESE